jgi:hypothetical protein
MSAQEQTAAAPQAPTVHDVLSCKVYLPEFIKACAARGIEPQNEEQLDALLNIAQAVRVQEMKTASAQTGQSEVDPLIKAAAAAQQLAGIEQDTGVAAYLQDPDVSAALEAGGLSA